jgi:hypothetical protein
MDHSLTPKGQKSRGSACLYILLFLIAALLCGIFVCLLVLSISVLPLVQAVSSPEAHLSLSAAGRLAISASNVFGVLDGVTKNFTIEDLVLIPANLPGLATSMLTTDIAPIADDVSKISNTMVESIAGLTFGELDQTGWDFASFASGASAVGSVAKILSDWIPATPPPSDSESLLRRAASESLPSAPLSDAFPSPLGAPAPTDPSSDPWHGLPSMIFGKSPIDWIRDQMQPDNIETLGQVCRSAQKQFQQENVLGFSYTEYAYFEDLGTIKPTERHTPVDPDTSRQILDVWSNVCDAFIAAAQTFKPNITASRPEPFPSTA